MSFWPAFEILRQRKANAVQDTCTFPPIVNYRNLLKKYMEHILDCESISYIKRSGSGATLHGVLSEKDVAALQVILDEINEE